MVSAVYSSTKLKAGGLFASFGYEKLAGLLLKSNLPQSSIKEPSNTGYFGSSPSILCSEINDSRKGRVKIKFYVFTQKILRPLFTHNQSAIFSQIHRHIIKKTKLFVK